MSRFAPLFAAGALLSASAAVHADVILGGGRSAGMGGAGLALLDEPAGRGFRNPAMYAMRPKLLRFYTPRFGYQIEGVTPGDYGDFFKFSTSGPLKGDNLGRLARDFGDERVTVGASADLGVQVMNFAVDVSAQMTAKTIPNESLRNWVNSGANMGSIPADAQLDGYGIGTAEVGFSSALKVPSTKGDLAVGARVKLAKAYYSHQVADAGDIGSGGSTRGPEMNGRSYLSKEGLGLDVGAFYRPGGSGMSMAFMVNNLISPTSGFRAIEPDNGGIASVRAFPTTFDAGVSLQMGIFLVAADVIDITNEGGMRELRFGVEFGSSRLIALRAGYASNSGITLGAGIGGFNIAVGERMPIIAGYSIRF